MEYALRDYIVAHVAVISPDKRVIKVKWIGYEIEKEDAWIYVELVLGTREMKGYWMQNTTLTDAFEQQVSMVNVHPGNPAQDLTVSKSPWGPGFSRMVSRGVVWRVLFESGGAF